jgi:hypothetical protein
MLGDIKFERHKRIDAAAADRWKQEWEAEDELGEVTCRLAQSLGYMKTAIRPITRRIRNVASVLAQLERLSEEEAQTRLKQERELRHE